MIFLFIIVALCLLSFVYDYRKIEKGKLFWWIFVTLLMICAAGFRYKMGYDSLMYEDHYKWQHALSQLNADDFKNTRFAPFFILLFSLCKSITDDFMIVQFVEATIVNCVFCRFIWKNSRHVFMAGLLYFFFLYFMLNMQVLREAIAASCFLLAWPYLRDRKWLKYYLMCVVAFLFHISAIALFFVPLCFVPGLRWFFTFGRRTLIIIPLVLAFSFVVNYFLFDFVKAIAVTEAMVERATTYSHDELGGNIMNINGIISLVFKYCLYPVAALYFLKRNRQNCGEDDEGGGVGESHAFEVMTLVAIYVSMLSVGVMIFDRYNHYFEIFALITISNWFFTGFRMQHKEVRLNYVYWNLIILPLFAAQIYSVYLNDYNKSGSLKVYQMYYPYSNQFDKELSPTNKKVIEYARKTW